MIYVGSKLYGYCGGYFGRDSYHPKRVEAIGADWVVVREESGEPNFASVGPDELAQFATIEEKERWERL